MIIPKELNQNRKIIECNFVLALYLQPELIPDYNIENGKDIITEDGMFYYGLAQNMYKTGYKTFDHMSIYEYLSDKEVLRNGFERRGGYNSVQEITNLLSISNIDVYYQELIKSNLLINLNKKGFPVVDNLDKFKDMSASDIYDYYEYLLSSISLRQIEKVHVVNLSEGYDKFIEQWDKGKDVGFPISSPLLNYQLLGIHKKELTLLLANSGKGKTTAAIGLFILPNIEKGNSIAVIANEQDESMWRQMLLSTVLFNKLKSVSGLSRHKMLTGKFTGDQKQDLKSAANWLEEQSGKVQFCDMPDYNITTIKKTITSLSKLGVSIFIVDTMKPANDASDKAWGEFSEMAKELFLLSKKLNVAIIATAQLSPESASRKFLDVYCIGKSKAIAETSGAIMMFRHLTAEEKSKIKPYKYQRDANGKPTNIKELITLNPDKDYIMMFTPKNRYGAVDPQIVMEFNMAFNTMKDVGWYECPYDVFKAR